MAIMDLPVLFSSMQLQSDTCPVKVHMSSAAGQDAEEYKYSTVSNVSPLKAPLLCRCKLTTPLTPLEYMPTCVKESNYKQVRVDLFCLHFAFAKSSAKMSSWLFCFHLTPDALKFPLLFKLFYGLQMPNTCL